MLGGNNGEASNRHPCASCKHQRRKCESDCIMAQFFPMDKTEEFQAAHKAFGVSNMSRMLKKLPEEDRGKAVESFVWEGLAWKQEPVHGPLGLYKKLEKENELLRNRVNQQQIVPIVPYVMESGLIGFNQCNINNTNEVTIASNKEDAINYGYKKENIELESRVTSYTNLVRGEEVKRREEAIATQENVRQRGNILPKFGFNSPIGLGFNSPIGHPMMQGYPMMQAQHPMISQGRGGLYNNVANFYNNVPYYRGIRALSGQAQGGVGQRRDVPEQQWTMNSNQDQFDRVTYEDHQGFNFKS